MDANEAFYTPPLVLIEKSSFAYRLVETEIQILSKIRLKIMEGDAKNIVQNVLILNCSLIISEISSFKENFQYFVPKFFSVKTKFMKSLNFLFPQNKREEFSEKKIEKTCHF